MLYSSLCSPIGWNVFLFIPKAESGEGGARSRARGGKNTTARCYLD